MAQVRRTQAERREATRTAILDATIYVLVKRGYAGLTTEAIVRKAGVTRGAHAHYFTSKPDLLVQALDRLSQQMRAEVQRTLGKTRIDYPELLDRMWQVHRGPLFTASLELHVAARTDRELGAHLHRFDHELTEQLRTLAAQYLPDLVRKPAFSRVVTTALAAMRGVAVLGFTAPPETVDRTWQHVRAELVRAGESAFDG
ncbi:TetR/AcrR family transcriptional regulator [Jongsikchunia kroppenstedtii]|uniref:TetR/AcrR family transcriptional regulator n=1 Tax=Jongsikchunia kroppenstedtii TaxID=1121721 RepID=UPI0003643F46|nr:TetR/AcrR family transcriptional regulator [Jongsikchunia kroppenstedtii]